MTQPGDSGGSGDSTGTADVPRALALGWHVVELYQAPLPEQAGPPQPDRRQLEALVSWSRLSPYERVCVYLAQVESDVRAVCLDHPDALEQQITAVRTCLGAACESQRADLNQALQTLHVQLITELTAQNPHSGKAYRLGSAMAQTALLPDRLGLGKLSEVLDAYRLITVAGWLRDLKSCLPDHASEAAQASLQSWRTWYVANVAQKAELDPIKAQRVRRALRAQGQIWSSLLTGEKRAIDLLTPDDYVDAAGDLTGQLAQLVTRWLRTRVGWLLIGLVAIIFVVSVVLVVQGIANSVVASGVAVFGAFGITAASVGAAVQQSVAPVQQALWQSDLTAAVSRAATRVPVLDAPKRRTRRVVSDEDLFAVDAALGLQKDGYGAAVEAAQAHPSV